MANQLATIETEVFDKVTQMVQGYVNKGELALPVGYSPENAMKSAWLKLQECTDTNRHPVLESCTKASIINALQSMLYQGLNPDKNQCYFIAYGDKLTLQRSYFGSMHVARTVDPAITDIFYDVVYEGDEFEYGKVRGRTVITKHIQKLQNVDKNKIIAAYCSVMRGDTESTTIMTMEEIKAAWRKSKMNPVEANGTIKSGSTHGQYTKDMAIKTVVNHACKYIINSSDDSTLLSRAFERTYDDTQSKADMVEAEIAENANSIDVDFEEAPADEINVDKDTGEVISEQQEAVDF
jgi:recombination protein RecT